MGTVPLFRFHTALAKSSFKGNQKLLISIPFQTAGDKIIEIKRNTLGLSPAPTDLRKSMHGARLVRACWTELDNFAKATASCTQPITLHKTKDRRLFYLVSMNLTVGI